MADDPVKISRYPNRRLYDHSRSRYVSLEEIEQIVLTGKSVEVRDSQTEDDLTRVVLARIIMERQPEKMQLFPVDMLHFMLRANAVMSDFLRDYFRHALPYLDYLQRHSAAAVNTLVQPMHWIKAWLDSIVPHKPAARQKIKLQDTSPDDADQLAKRVAELELRLRQLESEHPEGVARGS
jgi:polyhydroxyalkanoate synthesis repressor PhaR